MKPPICHLCNRNLGLVQGANPGKLVRFADFEPLPQGTIGHPRAAEWFCAEHVTAAQALAGGTIAEAMTQLAKQFGPPVRAVEGASAVMAGGWLTRLRGLFR